MSEVGVMTEVERQIRQDYRTTFGSDTGQRVLAHLKRRCFAHELSPFVSEDPSNRLTNFKLGHLFIYNMILELMTPPGTVETRPVTITPEET